MGALLKYRDVVIPMHLVVADYAAGFSSREIAVTYSVTFTTVLRMLDQLNIPRRDKAQCNTKVTGYNRFRRYGITNDEYHALVDTQLDTCAICARPQHHISRKHLDIDHDHKTGKVRGLLCTSCNMGLGAFRDDVACMTEAIKYLKKHSS